MAKTTKEERKKSIVSRSKSVANAFFVKQKLTFDGKVYYLKDCVYDKARSKAISNYARRSGNLVRVITYDKRKGFLTHMSKRYGIYIHYKRF